MASMYVVNYVGSYLFSRCCPLLQALVRKLGWGGRATTHAQESTPVVALTRSSSGA